MARLIWALLAVVACGAPAPGPEPVDPHLRSLGDAVSAWQVGADLLAKGDAEGARAALGRALAARPDDALLVLWMARAEAAAGDADGALKRVDALVVRSPDYPLARWWRATARARRDDAAGAAEDLKAAIEAGVITPRRAMRDADLARVLGRPELSFLPPAAMEAAVQVPSQLGFVGSEVDVKLDVLGAEDGPLDVAGAASGPVELVRVIEDSAVDAAGDGTRTVSWTLRVLGAGDATLGPLVVRQGGLSVTVPVGRWSNAAPPGRPPVPATQTNLRTPSSVLGAHVAPDAWREGSGAWIASPPGAHVETDPVMSVATAWSLRAGGEPVADLVYAGTGIVRFRVRGPGGLVWEEEPR